MKDTLKTGLIGLSMFLALAASAAAQSRISLLSPPNYSVKPLPAYWSGQYGSGAAISRTFAAGYFQSANGSVHAALFDLDGSTYQDLGVAVGDFGSFALAVNDLGQAAGYVSTTSAQRAVMFSDGAVTQIPKLPFFGDLNTISIAWSINNRGHVVGYEALSSGPGASHGFLYADGFLTDLGDGSAYAINERGTVVGESFFNGSRHAAKYVDSRIHDLGVLPGDDMSAARGINDFNIVVGHSLNSSTQTERPFIYGVRMKPLPSLPGDTVTLALGINNLGTIVGYAYDSTGVWHGVVWFGGQIYDLNTLVPAGTPHISAAYGVNDAGQIVTDSFLLSPIRRTCWLGPFCLPLF